MIKSIGPVRGGTGSNMVADGGDDPQGLSMQSSTQSLGRARDKQTGTAMHAELDIDRVLWENNGRGGRRGREAEDEFSRAVAEMGACGDGGVEGEQGGRSIGTLSVPRQDGWGPGRRSVDVCVLGDGASTSISHLLRDATLSRVSKVQVVRESNHGTGGYNGTTAADDDSILMSAAESCSADGQAASKVRAST